jgi:integrase
MGKRRANNEGSIWQRQDGRWTGAAYVLTSEGILKRTYVYGRTREDVHGKLVKMQDRSAQGIPVPAKAWKVGEYLDYWLTEVAARSVRPTTYAKYEVMIRLYLKPGLGRHRLDRLSVATVQTYFNSRLQGGDSAAKVHVLRNVLGAALTRAMREELIQRNVARLAALPPAAPARNRPWSASEARQFLAAARSEPLYLAFVLLIVYGLRRGEVLGLSWDDVDFGSDTFQVRQQLLRVGHTLQLGPVKTSAGKRELPLLGIAHDAFLSHETLRLVGAPATDWTRHQLVFTTRTGSPIEPRNLARSFERIVQTAGLRKIRLHDLRHTTATLLKTLKVQPREAMDILGHSRIAVTLEVYTDSDQDSRREAIGRIVQLFEAGAS